MTAKSGRRRLFQEALKELPEEWHWRIREYADMGSAIAKLHGWS
jgi:hypothetical protein